MPSASSSGRTWSRKTLACALGDGPAARGDARQLLARGQPVGAADGQAGLVAALQPGDPNHVELVEVGGEDRQELGPLQQGLAGVLGQREHAGVEVEPRQLAVQVAVVGQLRRGRGRAGGRHDRDRRRLDGLRALLDDRRDGRAGGLAVVGGFGRLGGAAVGGRCGGGRGAAFDGRGAGGGRGTGRRVHPPVGWAWRAAVRGAGSLPLRLLRSGLRPRRAVHVITHGGDSVPRRGLCAGSRRVNRVKSAGS